MDREDKIEKIYKYLGEEDNDYDSFLMRTAIVDLIAGIKTKKYIGKILNYAGQLSVKEHCIDHEWIPRPEYQADTIEEIERLEKISQEKYGVREYLSPLWHG